MQALTRVRVLRFQHVALIGAVLLAALPAVAVLTPVVGVDTPPCDVLAVPPLVDELGIGFPPGELIASVAVPTALPACPPTNGPPPNAVVTITNLNTIAFSDLWYVANPGTGLTNVDGLINGMLAFKIDAIGINTPLVFESAGFDGIFSPGESWDFIIQDYTNAFALPPSALGSIGVPDPPPAASGSIIALPIPEPASAALLVLGLLGLSAGRRRAGVHRKG